MKIVNDKLSLEQGDIIKLTNGTNAKFLYFNPWDAGLVHVEINGIKQCLFTSEMDIDTMIKDLKIKETK